MKTNQTPGLLALLAVTALQFMISAGASAAPAGQVNAVANYGQTSLRFEPNAGQTDPQVRYISRGSGYAMYFTPGAITLALDVSTNENDVHHPSLTPHQSHAHQLGLARLSFEGANTNLLMAPEQTLPEKINYLIGNDPSQWRTNLSAFGRVRYHDIYPGIDLVFHGNQTQLEYDYVIAPRADVKAIQLKLDGAVHLEIEPDGELAFSVQGRMTRFNKPVIYQTIGGVRRNIPGGYRLRGNRVSFEIGNYDADQPLVIDPVLSYSSYLGGSAADAGYGVAVDSSGCAYVCGLTLSTTLTNLVTPGAFQTNFQGGTAWGDGFIGKLDATGTNLVYFTYLGGSSDDYAYKIAVDASGDAYVVGSTASLNFPMKNPLISTNPAEAYALANYSIPDTAFVTELNTNGSQLVFSTYWGSSGFTLLYAVAVDSQNNVFVAGETDGPSYPTTNAVQSQWTPHISYGDPYPNDSYDGVVSKFSSNGVSVVYSTYYGGTNEDSVMGIAVDQLGNLYAAGFTRSSEFLVTNAMQPTYGGDPYDAFVFKLGPSGTNVIYSTFLGGNGEDQGYGISADTNGNAYIVGETFSANFPTTNALQTLINGTGGTTVSDGFLTKLSPNGQMIYSTYLGGSQTDIAQAVAVQNDGEVVIIGETGSTDFAPYANYGSVNSGNLDGFVARLNGTGNVLENFAYLGGTGADSANAVALDASDNAYVVGTTSSTNFPVTGTNVVQPTYGGGSIDAFITKLYFEPNQLGTKVITDWEGSNTLFVLGPPATLAASNIWGNASQIASISSNGVTSFANDRFQRGVSYDPTFKSFIIPLNQQTGFRLDDLGNNSENFGGSFPWFTRLQNDVRTHLSLVSSTNGSGITTNYYGYVTNFINPIAAFGATAGESPLYINEPFQFGVYCGAQYETPNSNGTNFSAPLRILVYSLSSFTAGQTNLVAPIATNYINIPRRTIAADSTNWLQFSTNGFSVTTTANGLQTTVQLVTESGGAWGVTPQFTNAQSGTYLITHECTTNLGYGYVVEGIGTVPLSTSLYPMVTNSAGAVGWDRLYSLDFEVRPAWRSVFIDQPQFNSQPMPSFYEGASPDELTNLNAVVTNSLTLTSSIYATINDSPELLDNPLLDQLVTNLNNDPMAIANYVQNQIELTDALAYNPNTGSASAPVVNAGGVNRSALDVYLEGQGSPIEQCALLVYLLRQAGYSAAYVFPTNNNVEMLDSRLSTLLRMQLHGAVNQYGQLYTTNTLITVNYPWVAVTISNQTVHLFPWLKDTQITEGLNLYDYMPTNYNTGFLWLQHYLYGDTNILGLSQESDAPSVLFPRFVTQQLLTNAPGVSLDDLGITAFNRQNYYSRWQDFPTPSVVNNPTQIGVVDNLTDITNIWPAMSNLFDTVTLTIYSQENTNTQMTVGPLRMADLHNREMYMATNGAGALTLWLASYVPSNTNQGAFNFSTDPFVTNCQLATLTISTNDTSFDLHLTHYRYLALNYSPTNQYLGVTETLQFTTPDRPFNVSDITAICFNVGQVSPAMINVHAQAYQQTAYQWSLNTNQTPSVASYQAAAAYLMGMDYYSHVSQFLPVCEQLHKVQVVSWYAEGLSRLTPEQLGAQNYMRPSMDMFYSEMAHAGNGTSHPDSGNDPLAGTDDFSCLMDGEIAAQEHNILNGYYQSANSVSAVVLLRLAQQRLTNGVSGIIELNQNNYLSVGATNAAGYGLTHLENYDTNIWTAVVNAFTGWDANYVRAYITPGPVSVQVAGYRGMGLVVVGKSQSASIISVNMNGALGPSSLYFGSTPAAISTVDSATSNPQDVTSGSASLFESSTYGLYNSGGDLYYGGSAAGGSTFDYYWTTPDWFGSSFLIYPYVMPVSQYQTSYTVTPPSQVNLAQQINDLNNYPQSTPVATSLTHALDSGNTGSPTWKNLKNYVYDPVNVMSGEFYHESVDLTVAGPQPFQLRRNYSSQNQDDRNGFGYGWDINVVPYLGVATNTTTNASYVILTAVELDGSVIAYRQQSSNSNLFLPTLADNPQLDNDGNGRIGSIYNPFNASILQSASGTNTVYTLTGADGEIRTYIVNSFPVSTPTNTVYRQRPYLTSWQDTQGNTWTFAYGTTPTQPSYGSITRIQCSNGNYLGLDYNAGGYVIDAYTSGGERTSYQYDDFGDLILAVRPDGSEETYEYQHTQYTTNGTTYVDSTHLLVEELKPDGRILQNVYDNQRRVTNQLATVGTDLNVYTNAIFTYSNNFTLLNMSNGISGYTIIHDVNGNTNRYDYTNSLVTTNTDQLGRKIIQSWYADNSTSPGYSRSLYQARDKRGMWSQFQYDSHGNVTNVFCWGDLTGDGSLQYATNTVSYNSNNLPVQVTDPVGNSVQTLYHPQYPDLPQFVVFSASGTPVITNQFAYGNVTNVVVNGSLTLTNVALGVLQERIRAVNSPDAATTQWTLDGRGYLTQEIQFAGTGDPAVTNYFTCDDQGDIIERTDGAGQSTEFSYDAMRRPIGHEVFAAGQTVPMFSEFAYYNENGELQWYQGPRSNPADYQWHDYDGAGRLTTDIRWRAEANPNGTGLEAPAGYNLYAQTFYQFDKFGNLLLAVDPRGAMTTNRWDALGQLIQRQYLDTNGTTVLSSEGFAYEPGGLVRYYTNALGGVTTNLYTTNGLPEFCNYPDGSTNAWRYYLDGRIKTQTQRNGAYWQTTYNDASRITTRIFYSPAGVAEATNSVQIDRRGNPIQYVDAGGNVFSSYYDGLDRVKIAIGPAITNVTSSIPGASPLGTNVYVTNLVSQAFTNYYDAAGQVTTTINAAGETNVSRFDALGRVTQTQIISASGTLIRQTSLAYAPDFTSVTLTNGSGASAFVNTIYTDNDGQNVLSVAYPSTGVTEYNLNQYDLAGNLVVRQHNSSTGGNVTTWTTASFTYDGLNRLTSKVDRDNALTTYGYDAMGDLTNRTLPGTPPNVQMLATYNKAGQKLKDWLVGGTSGTRTNTYSYFASGSPFAGLLQTRIDGRATTNTYSYDDWLRVTNQAATGSLPEQNLTTSWQFEPRGYLTNYSEQFASTNTGPTTSVQRTFDPYGQLATESVNGGAFAYNASQTWDATGRRSSLNVGPTSYGYVWQADGSLVYVSSPTASGSYSYDTAGMLTNRLVANRMTSITSRDGEGRPLAITTTVNAGSELGETLAWSGDGLLTNHTLVRGDFTDNRIYSYASQSRRLASEQVNLNATATWTNSFVYDRGVAGGPGALTTDGPIGASFGLWWSGVPDAFSRVNTETNNAVGFLAYGFVNGQSTLSAWLDNQPIQILDVGTNAMQWRTFLELPPGTHQLKVSALHPSGFYTAWATNTFTNSITNQVTFDSFDGSGNITNRVYRNASGATNRTQSLSFDAKGRLRLVMERNTNNYGFNWAAIYDGLNRRIATVTTLVSNGVPSAVPPQTLNSYFDPQVAALELGVSLSSAPQTEFLEPGTSPSLLNVWKLYGPDLDGTYGGENGTGGFEGASPYLNTFNPNINDARGNVLGEVTNGVVSWTLARQTACGSVPGYRPVAFGNGVDFQKSSPWRGREVDPTGYYWFRDRYYDPVSGQWLSYDPFWNEGDPNGMSFCAGDPVDYFDPDGRMGKAAYQSAENYAQNFNSFIKNTYFSMSYGMTAVTYGQNQANQWYGQDWQGLKQTVTGTAQTVYDTAAFASFELLSPIAPQQSAQAYGPSIDRLYNIDTDFTGGQGNSAAYRTTATIANAGFFMLGGRLGPAGKAGSTGAITRQAAWSSDLNAINASVQRLGQRALQRSGGDWRQSEKLFAKYLQAVQNRLTRNGSPMSVAIQPAVVPGLGRVPAFQQVGGKVFPTPGSYRLDAGIVGPNGDVLSGFDITLNPSKPSIVPYYQQGFGDIPIFDIRLP